MQSLSCLALAFLQQDMGSLPNDVHLMMIGMWIIVAALVLAFLALAVAGLMMLKVIRKVEGIAERADSKIWPLIDKTQVMVEELSPKVRTITTNVEQISYTVRAKVDEFSATASEINRTVKDANTRTQEKVARVDGMVNEALNTAHHVSRTVQDSVRKPIQQIAGVIAAMKRGVETLVERSPFKRHGYNAADVSQRRRYDVPTSEPDATAGTTGRYRTTEPTGTPTSASETKRVTPYG